MSCVSFKAGGALTDDHSEIYVERRADSKALIHLRTMNYLLVIEPRQQGKTSLINHLMCHPGLSNVAFAYADVTTPDRSTEAAWYQALCPRILRQLRGFIPRDQWPAIPQNSAGWREFLCDVAAFATDAHRRVVIALDEIGAVTFPGATEFFSVLRDVYNSRQAETEFKQLTFLLAGAFHPRDLIKDDKVSPFNIAERVRLCDFDRWNVNGLVKHLLLNYMDSLGDFLPKNDEFADRVKAISEQIIYWVDGQPYLTQWICDYLTRYGPTVMPQHVDEAVKRLRRDDDNHLPPTLKRLKAEKRLLDYVKRILEGERIKFYPQENRRQAQLELLGVIKEGPEGCCIIRNRIYNQVLAGTSGLLINPPVPEPTSRPELNDALTRRTLAFFIGADLPREVTGLPSRADLARGLARRKGLDESLSLAEVAQRVSQAGNRWEFTDFIRNALDTTGKSPQPFHQRIVELVRTHQIETLITTAYDNLLELAFQEAGVGINRVVRGSDVAFIRPDRPTLIRLYGDAQQPDTLVVTDRDHSNLLRGRDKEPLLDEVRRAFRRNTVFFLGYNLADPDFRFLFDQIAESRFARTAYAVWPGLPEADVRMWRDRGIAILDVDPLGILGEVGIPPVSPRRPEPTVTSPISQSFIGGKDMDYERGLDAFKQLAKGTGWYQDFIVHEAPLRENLRDERRYGPSEQTRRDRTRIVDQLNALALEHLGISFNDFCLDKQLPQKSQPAVAALADSEPDSEPTRLVDVLSIHLEHDGCPHKAGPAQWFSRLRIESKTPIHGCWGKIYEIRRLNGPDDQQGVSLPEFHASCLSWGSRGRSGVFEPISIQPKDTEYLDLVWRTHDDPPIPENQLRVASSLDHGERNTSSSDWGKRQDFIPLEPGYYLLVVQVWADGYNIPVECTYRLYWPGPGQENDVRLVEIVGAHGVKGDGASADPEPLYGIGNRWAALVGVNAYEDKANYGQLHVCVKDVDAIREQLIAGGFDSARIRLLTDQTGELPTKANILVALKAVADATEPDDLLLFYYSGHGDEDGGESYLVARDGRRLVLGDTAVPLARVREIVEEASARAKIIVLDACHSGADIGGKGPQPMSAEFIRRVFEQAEGLAILASCKQGQLSYEWRENERSAFTHFLLEALEGQADRDEKGFITVQDANRHVTNGVKLWASQRNLSQTPTLQYTVAGDIILVRYQ